MLMKRWIVLMAVGVGLLAATAVAPGPLSGMQDLPILSALPRIGPAAQDTDAQVELGRLLFFDRRLSGDASTSCASCHDPDQGWADGLDLSNGYPNTLYFRNALSVVGASSLPSLYWDGRFAGTDMQSLVRDHITEAHFMAADGRLVVERLKQIPLYEELFDQAFSSEPSFGGVLRAVSAFVSTLEYGESPYDRFQAGEANALSQEARLGLDLFSGKAGCASCHSGSDFTDGEFYNLGVSTNEDIFDDPLRHISFRRFFRNLGVPNFVNLREDPGLAALTKEDADVGKFRTSPLQGVGETAPYMHNGTFATLEDVVSFYNQGGGDHTNKDQALTPLGLTPEEEAALVAFLRSLSGEPPTVDTDTAPQYELRPLGDN